MKDVWLKVATGLLIIIAALLGLLWNAQQDATLTNSARITEIEHEIIQFKAVQMERESQGRPDG